MKLLPLLLAAFAAAGAHAAERSKTPSAARPVVVPLQADAPIPRMVVIGHRSAAATAKADADTKESVAQAKPRRDADHHG